MIKKIVISISAVVLITATTFGALLALRANNPAEPETVDTSTKLVIDTSKDYQACTALNPSAIKSSLGEAAADLQDPKNLGIIGEQVIGEGVDGVSADSQTCVYAFVDGGTVENGFNADNGFAITKTVYANPSGTAAVVDQISSDPTIVPVTIESGQAFYVANTSAQGPNAVSSFNLYVFSTNERTTYTIRQPSTATTFSTESAQTALRSLAEQAS